MTPAVLSVIKNEPGVKVIYFLALGFYPLLVWLYRDVKLRATVGGVAPARTSLAPVEVVSIVATASVGAAIIHAAVIAPHYREGIGTQLFFTITALIQLAWAFLLFRRPHRAMLVAGIAINAVIVLIWIQSRRSGLPIGHNPNQPEAVGPSDVIASLLELVVVFGCARLLRQKQISLTSLLTGRLLAPISCCTIVAIALTGFVLGGHHS